MNVNITTQRIAFLCLVLSVCLMVFLFTESRNDPSLRIGVLFSGTGLVASLVTIASTLLIGKDVTHPDPNTLPPGSTLTSDSITKDTVHTPPITTPKV